MPSTYAKVVEKPLWKWIFAQNTWLQLVLVLIAVLAALANLLPLEMQKRIVNEAIEESRLNLLIYYCTIYLAAVVSATLLKYLISILQTIIGQKTTERMRESLYRHILMLPLGFYRRTQPGLIVSALTTELATAGDFIGMAVAVPATNLLMLAAFAGYLLWLNPLLAMFSFGIYPIILLVLPVLQKQVNRYNRKRVDATRKMSGKTGETVEGMHEIHANNTFISEGDGFAHLVQDLRSIRIIWNLYRQGIKRTNSLFVNFSRFLVFAVGGYLAINGNLELGVLVAFISAQDKLYDPWKEMISYYQAYKTAQVTYERTMGYFAVASAIQLAPTDRDLYRLKGNIVVKNLSFATADDTQLLTDIDLEISHGEHLALVGFSGSGKSTLVNCIGQLYPYSGGKIAIDGKEVSELSKADIAANIGFVSQEPFIFAGTIKENLLYGHLEKNQTKEKTSSPAVLETKELVEILEKTSLFNDVLSFGLNTVLDVEEHNDLVDQLLAIRRTVNRQQGKELSGIIEFYNPDSFHYRISVAENILYGESDEEKLKLEKLHKNKFFMKILHNLGLLQPLLKLGAELIEETLKVHEQNSTKQKSEHNSHLISEEDLEEYQKTFSHQTKISLNNLPGRARQLIVRTALHFVPDRDTFVRMPAELEESIVANRSRFKEELVSALSCEIHSCDLSTYLYSRSILTNILFGNIKDDSAAAYEKIYTVLQQLLKEHEIMDKVVEMGLMHEVGSAGANLSGGQKQKLAIARTLLKKPAILLMDEATSGLDNNAQERIEELLEDEWRGKSTLVAIVHRLDMIKNYDRIAVMKDGKIVETGTYTELLEDEGILAELVQANQ